MNVPSLDSFAIQRVKMLKNGGLDVHYKVDEISGSETYTTKYHVERMQDIHPDLRDLFKALRPFMADVLRYTELITDIRGYMELTTPLHQRIEDCYNNVVENINVTGISLAGKEENAGATIAGTFETQSHQKMAIVSPRIKFAEENYGFEIELQQIIDEIEAEVYRFLFEDKKAQLEIFG